MKSLRNMQGIWATTAKFGLNVEICPLFCCYVVSNEQNSPRVGPSNTQNELEGHHQLILCITRSSLSSQPLLRITRGAGKKTPFVPRARIAVFYYVPRSTKKMTSASPRSIFSVGLGT